MARGHGANWERDKWAKRRRMRGGTRPTAESAGPAVGGGCGAARRAAGGKLRTTAAPAATNGVASSVSTARVPGSPRATNTRRLIRGGPGATASVGGPPPFPAPGPHHDTHTNGDDPLATAGTFHPLPRISHVGAAGRVTPTGTLWWPQRCQGGWPACPLGGTALDS